MNACLSLIPLCASVIKSMAVGNCLIRCSESKCLEEGSVGRMVELQRALCDGSMEKRSEYTLYRASILLSTSWFLRISLSM